MLSVRKDTGAIVSLEGGGAGGDLWSDPVDSNIIPDFDNTRDLGSGGNQFRNLFIDGTANIDFLSADNGFFTGGLTVTNTLTANGILNATNDVILGNTTGDRIDFIGRVETSIQPDSQNIRDLGASARRWRTLYVRQIISATGLTWDLNGANINDVGNLEIDGDLNHDGSRLGFFNTSPQVKITVGFSTGSQASNTAAVNNLLAALKIYGLIG